jgi:uncharacterized repeat protein (TIGR01451 family)
VSDPVSTSGVIVGTIGQSQGLPATVTSNTIVVELGPLASGADAVITYDVLTLVAGSLDNTAFVSGLDSVDPDLSNNTAFASVAVFAGSGPGEVDLSTTSSVVPQPGVVGGALAFQTIVENFGPDMETNAVLSQSVPVELNILSITSDKGSVSVDSNNVVTVVIGALDAGESVGVTILAEPTVSGNFVSNLVVTGDVADANVNNNVATLEFEVVDAVGEADLTITKTVLDQTVVINERTTWTVTLVNDGPDTATQVLIFDTVPTAFVPEDVVFTSGSGTLSLSGGTLVVDIGELPVGGVVSFDIFGQFIAVGDATNVVTVTSSEADPNDGRTASATVTVIPFIDAIADLEVSKAVSPGEVILGEEVVFTLTMTNNGPDDAINAVLTDVLPAEYSILEVTADIGTTSVLGQTVSLNVPVHPVGVTATLTVRAVTVASGLVVNTASVTSDTPDDVVENNSASASVLILPLESDMRLEKTVETTDGGPFVQDGAVIYTISVTNDGPATAQDVLVVDDLPPSLEIIDIDADIGTPSVNGQIVTLSIPEHPAGVTATLLVTAIVRDTGVIVNEASVETDSVDPDLDNNVASASFEVIASSDLGVTTSINPATPALGLQSTFSSVVTNFGPQDANNVVAIVQVPVGYVITQASTTFGLGSLSGQTYTVSVGSLTPGGSFTINIVTVAQILGAQTFTVNVGSDTFDPNVSNNFASRSVTADPSAIPQLTENFNTPPGPNTVIPFGSQITNVIGAGYVQSVGAIGAAIFPGAPLPSRTGVVSEGSQTIPYSAVGPDRIVRGKFSVWQQSLTQPFGVRDPANVPSFAMRIANRFAVTSMLEIKGNQAEDPAIAPFAAEITPSADPNNPSIYRVDLDPIDVPFLTQNPSEGIRYGFEAKREAANQFGVLWLTDVVLATYSRFATPGSVTPVQTFAPSGGGAGNLANSGDGAFLDRYTLQFGPNNEIINFNRPGTPAPSYTEGAFGITMDTVNVPIGTVGVVSREFAAGSMTARPRVQEGRQYQVRVNMSSLLQTVNQTEIRLRARSLKFAYSQSLQIGGAWAIGTNPLVGNAAIANQSLPGIGTLNPDRRVGQTNGGWYNLIIHSPLNRSIRPEFPPAVPLTTRMPLLTSQPGPGVNAGSFRDLRVGADLIDGVNILQGPNAALEQGNVTIDAIEIREFNQVPD